MALSYVQVSYACVWVFGSSFAATVSVAAAAGTVSLPICAAISSYFSLRCSLRASSISTLCSRLRLLDGLGRSGG
uniref:Putative secreted peptide n=1 Tax=Anopheles braziliensis TaxID=58242 RepID=A0A2M3ZRD5_9DIPT